MGGIGFDVHPLFFLFGVYYALTGRITVFIVYTLTAVIHEFGHSLAAAKRGYRLNKIILMPFGAVVTGNVKDLKLRDQAAIALAGPFTNLALGLFFVATWWLFPETYAYTDIAAEANFTLAAVNFIPAYPLDGGRIIYSVLGMKFGEKKAFKICRATGIILSLLLFIMFILTAFYSVNLSLLFFSAFVFFGAARRKPENEFVKIYSALNTENLKRGVRVQRFAVDKSATVKTVMGMMDGNVLNEAEIFDGENSVAVLKQKRLSEIMETADIYSPIGEFLTIPESKRIILKNG